MCYGGFGEEVMRGKAIRCDWFGNVQLKNEM